MLDPAWRESKRSESAGRWGVTFEVRSVGKLRIICLKLRILHEEVARAPEDAKPTLGSVFQQAVDHGLNVRAIRFEDGKYLNVATPDGLGRVVPDVVL